MTSEQATNSTLVAIRAAHHPEATPKYDRVVFEFDGPVPLVQIQYAKELIADGPGNPIPVAGAAILHVEFFHSYAHNDSGEATVPGRLKQNMPLVKEIVRSGDFEAVVAYGIGISRKAETRIITLAGKSRVVIDFIL